MLRAYREEDIKRIVFLEQENLASSLGEDFYRQDLTNPLARHYVLDENGQVLGFISSVFDGFSLEILNFVIDKPYQSKGYGTRLLASFLDELVPLGLNHVSLEVRESNIKAIQLYKKFDFQVIRVREKYYSNLENALVMQKIYDDKKDIIELEATLFSKKDGIKYTSDFKERYCLNYYDLYNKRITTLDDFKYEDYILFLANWTDEKLFDGFDISACALMHVNAFHYQSLAKKEHKIHLNYLEDYKEYTFKSNIEYGEDYALKYANFSYEKIKEGKEKQFSFILNDKTIGSAKVLEYHHSIFILGLYVEEQHRNKGIAASLMDACVTYAKHVGKCEIYLEAELDDTPIEMYKRMNFIQIDIVYEMLKVK